MPKKIDIQEIAVKNPQVNLVELEEGRKLLELLRSSGSSNRHRVVFPANRRRIRLDDDIESDPRAVRLQRISKHG